MIIFPAIDLKNGHCVRLEQGDFNKSQVFSQNPVDMALKWESQGGAYLHLVDLDGAKDGSPANLHVIKDILSALTIPVQIGGGIRNMKYGETLLELGVSRIILGTAALHDKAFAEEAIKEFGERVAVSIDAKEGLVATHGWVEVSEIKSVEFAKELESFGLETLIYTDIAKDGMMEGPNLDQLEEMQKAVRMNIIASGGVSFDTDLLALKELDLYGAIIGKALYTGAIDLENAIKIVKG